jgi:hypothetical protein
MWAETDTICSPNTPGDHMSIEVTRISVDGLSCQDCDCGSCLTGAVAALKAINGVVYVGIDRRRLAFVVRYDESETDAVSLRNAVLSSGLVIAVSEN